MKKTKLKKHNHFHKKHLNKEGSEARELIHKICNILTHISGRNFYAQMYCTNNRYEAHIIDTGRYKEIDLYTLEYSTNKDDPMIGMIFFGGHYDRRKRYDAEEMAWISLVLDCIGQCEDVELRATHNLTRALEDFGPHIDFNFDSIDDLKKFLNSYDFGKALRHETSRN